jgi:hypothetical protein
MERHSSTACTVMLENKKEDEEAIKEQTAKVTFKQLKPKLNKKVSWTEDTVNNENMGKKKSKSNIFY